MSHIVRRILAPTAFLFVVSLASSGEAFTLGRLATTVDLGKLVSASQIEQPSPGAVNHGVTLEPGAADLALGSTEFRVNLAAESDVLVEVIDEGGRCVCSARAHMPAGVQKVGFSGRDAQGRALPNGLYKYTVTAGNAVRSARVTISR